MAADVSIRSLGAGYQLYHDPKALKSKDGDVYYRTDIPDGYTIDGLPGLYLLGRVTQRKSNLNLITLSLVGDNGVEYCHDTLDTNEALRTVSKMKAASTVNYESIGTIYVGE
jgi:hypothetical protein